MFAKPRHIPNDMESNDDDKDEHFEGDEGIMEFDGLMNMEQNDLPMGAIVGFNVATLALGSQPRLRGLQGYGPREKKPGGQGKSIARVKPRGSLGIKAKGSPGVTSHTPRSVRKCEGMNPHTPKATPILGDGVPVDSRNFRERFEGPNLNVLRRSLYHWKALEV
jgi:hypothetical protein